MVVQSQTHFDAQPTASNHFSWLNTVLALQRTLMAATRTAVALIGFGFTVAQFFQRMRDTAPAGAKVMMKAAGPRNFGLALIAAGVVSLIVFTWQYHVAVRRLWTGQFAGLAGDAGQPLLAPVYIVSIVVILIGLAAFGVVFARL